MSITEGQWVKERSGLNIWANGRPVCGMYIAAGYGGTAKEANDNAQAISAVPDLLAVAHRSQWIICMDYCQKPNHVELCQALSAALTKAEGG